MLLAVVASAFLLVVPTYAGGFDSQTLLEVNGGAALLVLTVATGLPLVAVAALAVHVRTGRHPVLISAAGFVSLAMCVGVFVSSASVGMFYAPSALLLAIAAVLGWATGREQLVVQSEIR